MKPIEVKAHLNSLDGKTGRAILLGPNYLFTRPITNSYVSWLEVNFARAL